jgi:hypothetical protein
MANVLNSLIIPIIFRFNSLTFVKTTEKKLNIFERFLQGNFLWIIFTEKNFLRPFIESNTGWYTLAMATTLPGNLTLLGSIANLIVAESVKKQGVHLSFFQYLKAGVPITFITILAGVIWLNYFGIN